MKRRTCITVSGELVEKLEQLRREMGARSLAEVIKLLVVEHEEAVRKRIRMILCNDMSDVSASAVAWIKLLASRGLRASELQQAFKYLAGSVDELRVNMEKCREE
ncbi:MAG: hypothetical protein QXM08_03585 [Thermofilaceae archaeon]